MKAWQPINNGGKFYVQLTGAYAVREDSRGRPVHYRSIKNAQKAADLLNLLARPNAQALIAKARKTNLVIDHINGDTTDNRPENLRVVRASERQTTS